MARKREELRAISGDVAALPHFAVGYGLFWLFRIYMIEQHIYPTPPVGSFLANVLLQNSALLFYALGFLVIGMMYKLRGIVLQGKGYQAWVLAFNLIGSLLTAAPPAFASDSAQLALGVSFAGGALVGVSSAFLHLEWARAFGVVGPRKMIGVGVAGILLAAVAFAILQYALPGFVRLAITPVSFLASGLLLFKGADASPRPALDDGHAVAKTPWKLMMTTSVQGFSFGVMLSIYPLADPFSELAFESISTACYVLVAPILIVTIILMRLDFDTLLYKLSFPCMALGFILLWIPDAGPYVGLFVFSVGFRNVVLLYASLCSYLTFKKGVPTNWVFSIPVFTHVAGRAVGFLACYAALRFSADPATTSIHLASLAMLVTLMCALISSSHSNLREGWGFVQPGEVDEMTDSSEASALHLARRFDLTARETEILLMLAKGHTRPHIANRLSISIDTVKSHANHIYVKLDVHSRQELLNLINGTEVEVRKVQPGVDSSII